MPNIEMKKNQADKTLIKNPFVCNSNSTIRLSLDKDPRRFKGDTQYAYKVELEENKILLHNPTDNKLSYTFGKPTDNDKEKDIIDIDKYDYQIPAETLNKTSKVKHKDGLPLSFLQIRTEEEGLDWYARHFPKIPTDLLPIIARHHWGEPITKKGIKNERKKIEKKLHKQGLKIEQKKVVVSFE